MSAILIKTGNEYNSPMHKEFQLASAADVGLLPGLDECAIGSIAYTADLTYIAILGENGVWHAVG